MLETKIIIKIHMFINVRNILLSIHRSKKIMEIRKYNCMIMKVIVIKNSGIQLTQNLE